MRVIKQSKCIYHALLKFIFLVKVQDQSKRHQWKKKINKNNEEKKKNEKKWKMKNEKKEKNEKWKKNKKRKPNEIFPSEIVFLQIWIEIQMTDFPS